MTLPGPNEARPPKNRWFLLRPGEFEASEYGHEADCIARMEQLKRLDKLQDPGTLILCLEGDGSLLVTFRDEESH